MDLNSRYTNPNPKLSASILSRLTLSWLVPLFWYGRKHDIEAKDIYDVLPENESEQIGEMLGRSWHKEIKMADKTGRKPSLFKAVARTFFWPTIYYAFLLSIAQILLRLLLQNTMENYIKYYNTKASIWNGIGSASLVVLAFFAMFFTLTFSEFKLQEIGMRVKIACTCLIYRKVMRLSCVAMTQIDEGHIINLLSNDIIKWENFFVYAHFSWIAPVQFLVVAYIMREMVKTASIVGLTAFMLQTLPVQGVFNKLIYKLRLKAEMSTDRRVLMVKEIIIGIKVIKMYNWEKPFTKLVLLLRKREIKLLKMLVYMYGISMSIVLVIARNSLFVTIVTYFFIEGRLMAPKDIFSIWRYLSILQGSIAMFLPYAVASISETKAVVKRIEKFLLLEEMKNNIQYYPKIDDNNKSTCVYVRGVSVSWGIELNTNILSEINLEVPSKQLFVVLGPTASGKSSLLKLLLGELQPKSGCAYVHGKVSYSSQEPWLFPGSVKNNIIFGEPYDEVRYTNVTNVCALKEDFKQLPYGDKTLVGEGGSVLSGGQRARINLARAIYRKADIYLLDDCLSAVDVSVGKVIYKECFKNFLKEKTCIIITHHLQYLDDNDKIILMNKGTITYQGTFANLQKDDEYSQYVFAHINESVINESEFEIIESKKNSDECFNTNFERKEDEELSETGRLMSQSHEPKETDELVVKGKIATILYWKYFKAGGSYSALFLIAFLFLITQVFLTLNDFWVQHISEISAVNISVYTNLTKTTSVDFFTENRNKMYTAFYIYAFIIIGSTAFVLIRNWLFFRICMNASKKIHNKMFIQLLGAPLSFFNVNNIGRIINRFSQDIRSVDDKLAASMFQAVQTAAASIALLLQIYMVQWWLIFPSALSIVIFTKLQYIYQSTARDIKRLEGIAKGSVLSHINSNFTGLLTIRSSRLQELVYEEFNNLQNHHTSAYYLVLAGKTICNLWTDFVKNLFIALISYGFLFTNSNSMSINFIYTQICFLLSVLEYILKIFTEILILMINLERVFQYIEVKQEDLSERNFVKQSLNSWPSHGCIQFEDLYLKYFNSNEPILKNLNFRIAAGEKVGIVGRTGAGKSSLVAALFRIVDFDGCIYIDNVNIKKLGLENVRSKISIIPQDSLLFSMSLRENLDPNNEYSDEVIWSALEDVGLRNTYTSLDELLDKNILSMGQIQLLSLARVILKKNKILVLDEASANLDNETDISIQNVIKNKFKDCTVISIAHRLNTVIDSDKVLVIDNGQILEFDHPYVLLQKEGGVFQKMARQSNDIAYENLKQIAKDVWIKNQKYE